MTATAAPDARIDVVVPSTARGLVASELFKLTTTRATGWILLSGALLAALAVSGASASGGVPLEALGTDTGLRTVLEHGGVAAFLALALGILASAGEFRHGTIVDTLLTEPRRTRVLAAKAAAGAAVGLVAGAILAVATAATAAVTYAAKDVPFDLTSTAVVNSLVGIALWATLYAVIGVAVGTMIRNPATAIVVVAIWLFGAESAIAALLVEVGRWLPATAARSLGNAPHDGMLDQVGGGVVLLGWVAFALLGAAITTRRRDVT